MNEKEAIEILEGLAVPIHAEKAFDMAVEALNKQIPMKTGIPELSIDHRKITPCGNCGSELENRMWNYCPWCGQAILE